MFGCSRHEHLSVCQSLFLAVAFESRLLRANSSQNSLSGTEHPLEKQSCQSKDLEGQKLRTECVAEREKGDTCPFSVTEVRLG